MLSSLIAIFPKKKKSKAYGHIATSTNQVIVSQDANIRETKPFFDYIHNQQVVGNQCELFCGTNDV